MYTCIYTCTRRIVLLHIRAHTYIEEVTSKKNCYSKMLQIIFNFFFVLCTQMIKDWVLFIIVGVITGIDALILLIATSVPQIRFNSTLDTDIQHPTDVSVRYLATQRERERERERE